MTKRIVGERYELQDRIGAGGMAEVYLALDHRLGRQVAVKVLYPAYAADPAFVERFRREARAAAALNHPHIAAVYDWGSDGDTYYMVMEYVPGGNLKEALREHGPCPEGDALRLGAQIASALEAAHRQGVIHRDVKPHNVLLDLQKEVKVVDFGIARAVGAAQLTQTMAVLGSAHYLSPEQAQRQQVDFRSDLYNLGVVLYELLTGQVPFTGDSPLAIAWQHVHQPPTPPGALRPGISPATEAVVLKALAKEPAARYLSATAFADDLRRFLEEHSR